MDGFWDIEDMLHYQGWTLYTSKCDKIGITGLFYSSSFKWPRYCQWEINDLGLIDLGLGGRRSQWFGDLVLSIGGTYKQYTERYLSFEFVGFYCSGMQNKQFCPSLISIVWILRLAEALLSLTLGRTNRQATRTWHQAMKGPPTSPGTDIDNFKRTASENSSLRAQPFFTCF